MFRTFVASLIVMLAACAGPAAAQDNPAPQLDPTVEYFGSQKPILCQKTEALLKKFTDDQYEQLLGQYRDPVHNTGGMLFWNAEHSVIHVVEFPPAQKGEWACVVVFGTEVRMDEYIRKKGQQKL